MPAITITPSNRVEYEVRRSHSVSRRQVYEDILEELQKIGVTIEFDAIKKTGLIALMDANVRFIRICGNSLDSNRKGK